MRIQTKRTLLRAATAAAVACTAAVIFFPAAASAAPASATAAVNVRTGPSTSYDRVDTLRTGKSVDVGGCRNGWCYITHSGADGWVSSNYLRRGNAPMEPNFNLSFNFPGSGSISVGTGGVSIGVGTPIAPAVPVTITVAPAAPAVITVVRVVPATTTVVPAVLAAAPAIGIRRASSSTTIIAAPASASVRASPSAPFRVAGMTGFLRFASPAARA